MPRRTRDDRTLDLFDVPQATDVDEPLPGSMDYRAELSALVAKVFKEAPIDRWEIAARMSRLTGRDVTKAMIDAYASEARDLHNLPAYLIPALDIACNSTLLTTWTVGKRGGRALFGREVVEAEIGRLDMIRDEAARRSRELKKALGDSE